MDSMLAKYFDGDLDEREAGEFLDAVAADPDLERELSAYERVLAMGKQLPSPSAPGDFTRSVMADIATAASATPRRPQLGWRWNWQSLIAPVAVAAALALAFTAGWNAAPGGGTGEEGLASTGAPLPTGGSIAAGGAIDAADPAGLTAVAGQPVAADGYRYVRLAYLAPDPNVADVRVVGSFNNWDPSQTPMQERDGVWTTVLVLPPGSYEYMFVVNGDRWVTDPLAVTKHDDGFGGANGVIDVAW